MALLLEGEHEENRLKRGILTLMVTAMIAAGGGVLMSTTPAFAATTTCTGTLAGGAPTVTGNVIVPAGATATSRARPSLAT
jgi:hypothetical protein